MIRGSCLCRTVQWEIKGPLQNMTHCHCSRCRKATGGAFATFVFGSSDGFRFTSGADAITQYETANGKRPFCSICGSTTPGQFDSTTYMPAGCLDDDPGCRPEGHIFVGSKASWYEVPEDGVERHDEYPPGFESPELPEPEEVHPASRPGAIRGSCLCGGVRFETGAPLALVNCHCSRCRKGRSAAHAANLFTDAEGFRFTQGQDLVRSYELPEAKRFAVAFCTRCGSAMTRGNTGERSVAVPASCLDDDIGTVTTIHIFTDSKAPWFEIPGGSTAHEVYPPGVTNSHHWAESLPS